MSEPNEPTIGDPLDAVIAEYVQQVEAGEIPDREALLARHPELAERLREFFADYDQLDRQAAELRLSADPNRTTNTAGSIPEAQRVHYFGDYELLELIAHGDMGIVHKARQMSLNRVVAVKMILRGELTTERDVARFRAEAEAAANLDHPNIVPIYEVGEYDGLQYYSMRYVEGASLAHRPRNDARSEARLVAAVAGAVHHAHRRGVLHRDIKPSNILVDTDGVPLVADFGLAKRVDADGSLTESGVIVGTPRYMAPEQAAGRKDLTVAVDVYSLGVVLYERLTGLTPFTGETVLELLRQAREEEPPRPSSVCPGLDRDLETICLKCLERDPAKRYPSAEALQDDLESWLRGEPIKARPVGQAERFWRWCRRNPVMAALSAGLAAALLAVTAISIALTVQAQQLTEVEREGRRRAEKAEDDREQALARSLVWPLKPEETTINPEVGIDDKLSEPEAKALWELAENPGERLWLRFVAEATLTPQTASQLSRRAELAWIAATGLDAAKRKRAEEQLMKRLEDADARGRGRIHLVLAAFALGDLSPASSHRIVNLLVEEMASKDWLVFKKIATSRLVGAIERMEPPEAARILTLALEKDTEADARGLWADKLEAVARRMEPAEAARVLGQAGRILKLALEKETDAFARTWLATPLETVAGRMEPAEAARVLGQAGRILKLALEKETDAHARMWLATGLETVAGRMEPAEAARALTLALEKETDTHARWELALWLADVIGRMETREAARLAGQVASTLTLALEKETMPDARRELAKGLAAVAGRMETREAARALTLALEKETDALDRIWLAEGLAAVAGRLSRAEAFTVCHPVLQTLLNAPETEMNGFELQCLASATASLLAASENGDEQQIVRRLVFAICSDRQLCIDDHIVNRLGPKSLDALLTDDNRSEVSCRTVALATVVGLGSAMPFAAHPALPAATEPLPCRLSTQDLVELLKMPTCVGEARKVVLGHLGNRYGRVFANHWEFVRFAQEQHLDLDLTSPPKRWRRP